MSLRILTIQEQLVPSNGKEPVCVWMFIVNAGTTHMLIVNSSISTNAQNCLKRFAVGCTVQMYSLEGAALRDEEKNESAKRPDLLDEDNCTVLIEGNIDMITSHDEETASVITELRRRCK